MQNYTNPKVPTFFDCCRSTHFTNDAVTVVVKLRFGDGLMVQFTLLNCWFLAITTKVCSYGLQGWKFFLSQLP